MVTIAEIADRIGGYLHQETEFKYDLKMICYGTEVFLVFAISSLIMILMGSILGAFEETVLIVLASFAMKSLIGGPHLSGYFRCVLLSSLIIVSFSYAASKSELWLSDTMIYLIGLSGILILIFYVLTYNPLSVNYFPSFSCKKIALILFTVFWLAAILVNNVVFSSVLLGFYIPIVSNTPVGRSFVNVIEKNTKRGGN